jgi:LacI family transcriptional regulator
MQKHVHIAIHWHNPRILQGFCRYAHEANWHIDPFTLMTRTLPENRPGDGLLLTNISDPAMKKKVARLMKRMPAVMHGMSDFDVDVPTSETDEYKIGCLAAEHFYERGHKNFVMFTARPIQCIRSRMAGFSETLNKLNCTAQVYSCAKSSASEILSPWLRAHLSKVATPCAVFASDDVIGAETIAVALKMGLRVPEDIAVLGVGNIQLVCDYARVPLSSVAMPTEEQAYRAAQMLDRLMKGKKLTQMHSVLPPVGVVLRQSSEVFVATHPIARQAIDTITQNAFDVHFSIHSLPQKMKLSKSSIYRVFHDEVRTSPQDFLIRIRLARAQEILSASDEKVEVVSKLCGYSNCRTFQRHFFEVERCYPSEWRRKKKAEMATHEI